MNNFEYIKEKMKTNPHVLNGLEEYLSDSVLHARTELEAGLLACECTPSCDDCICVSCCRKDQGYQDGWENFFLADAVNIDAPDLISDNDDDGIEIGSQGYCDSFKMMSDLGFSPSDFI